MGERMLPHFSDRRVKSAVEKRVLGSPVVNESLDNSVPVRVRLIGCISSQSSAEHILPLLGRHGGEVPRNGNLALGGHSSILLDKEVGRFGSALEGNDKAHLVGESSGALVARNAPVHEIKRSLDVSLGSVLVDAPVVLGAGAKTLLRLVACAHIDGDHGEIVVGVSTLSGQSAILPGTVLEEDSLAGEEFVAGVINGLGGKLSRSAGGIVDVQVEDLAIVVEEVALDGVELMPSA